jgi:hypothetical protein
MPQPWEFGNRGEGGFSDLAQMLTGGGNLPGYSSPAAVTPDVPIQAAAPAAMPTSAPSSMSWGPLIALALTGLSKDPNAQGRAFQGYMVGNKMNEDKRKREDTIGALSEMMNSDPKEHPADMMTKLQKYSYADPSILAQLAVKKLGWDSTMAQKLLEHTLGMKKLGAEYGYKSEIEKGKEEAAQKRTETSAGATINAAQIGGASREKAAGISADLQDKKEQRREINRLETRLRHAANKLGGGQSGSAALQALAAALGATTVGMDDEKAKDFLRGTLGMDLEKLGELDPNKAEKYQKLLEPFFAPAKAAGAPTPQAPTSPSWKNYQ